MTHLHIPDAAIPAWIALSGYILMAIALFVAIWSLRGRDARKSIALTGVVGAFMLVAMSVPLGPLPVHLNLAVLAGVILGPAMATICAFSVNVILALTGHGGVTAIGLNTLVLSLQSIAGGLIFSALRKGRMRTGVAAGLSTAAAVALSLVVVLIVFSAIGAGHVPAEAEPPGESHEHEIGRAGRAAAVVGPLALAGAVAESVVAASVLAFIERIRPEMLGRKPED